MLRMFSKFRKNAETDLTAEVEELRSTRGDFHDQMNALKDLAQRGVEAIEAERDQAIESVTMLRDYNSRQAAMIDALKQEIAELKNKDKREDALMTAIVSARDLLNEIV